MIGRANHEGTKDTKGLVLDESARQPLHAALDALCWVLLHHHSDGFPKSLADIEAGLAKCGYSLRRLAPPATSSDYTLQRVERFSDQYPVPALRLHAAGPCGHRFQDVAAIIDPDSENPGLLIPRPLGLKGVRAILALIDESSKNFPP